MWTSARHRYWPAGVAFRTGGNGFWAPITGLVSLTPDRKTIVRAVFTDNKETPGLGGRITEEAFQKERFAGLDASKPEEGSPYLYVASERPKSRPRARRTVDAITGATVSSKAVSKILKTCLERVAKKPKTKSKSFGIPISIKDAGLEPREAEYYEAIDD